MSALDKTWHPEHFFCAHCGLQFGEEEFHEKNEKVFCRRCFFDIFAARFALKGINLKDVTMSEQNNGFGNFI